MQQTRQNENEEGSETSKRLLNSMDVDRAEIQRFSTFNQSWIDHLAVYAKDPRIASVIKVTLTGLCGGIIFGALAGASIGLNEAKKHIAERTPRPTLAQAQNITGNMVGKTMTRMSGSWAWKTGLLAVTFSSVANLTDYYLTDQYKIGLSTQKETNNNNNKSEFQFKNNALDTLTYAVAGFATSSLILALYSDARKITPTVLLGGALAGGCFGLSTSLSQYSFSTYKEAFTPVKKEPVKTTVQQDPFQISNWIREQLVQADKLETEYAEHLKVLEEVEAQKKKQPTDEQKK